MTWGVVAVVGGNVVNGILGSNAASDAADAQKGAAEKSDATQRYFYDTTRADNRPALDARNWAIEALKQKLTSGGLGGAITPQNVQNEAGYQFGMQQGMQGLNNSLAARGMRNSGAALKAATRFGTDYATTKYDNAFNREISNRSAQLNPLQSLANVGQTGASTIAAAGANAGNNISASQSALGNALGASSIAGANAWGNALNQSAGWYANQQRNNAISPYQLEGQRATAGSGAYGSYWSASNPFEL